MARQNLDLFHRHVGLLDQVLTLRLVSALQRIEHLLDLSTGVRVRAEFVHDAGSHLLPVHVPHPVRDQPGIPTGLNHRRLNGSMLHVDKIGRQGFQRVRVVREEVIPLLHRRPQADALLLRIRSHLLHRRLDLPVQVLHRHRVTTVRLQHATVQQLRLTDTEGEEFRTRLTRHRLTDDALLSEHRGTHVVALREHSRPVRRVSKLSENLIAKVASRIELHAHVDRVIHPR